MDIVERLNDDTQCFCSIRKEAADEIERLREALGKIKDMALNSDCSTFSFLVTAMYVSDAALKQKDSE